MPSARIVEAVGMTEADFTRDLFRRIAEGSTLLAECRRLNAMGVMLPARYRGGASKRSNKGWYPTRLAYIVHNLTYVGRHRYRSKHGTVERTVPALIDEGVWNEVQLQVARNQHRPKGNESRLNLLRNLITCGICGMKYVGTPGYSRGRRQGYYYKCGNLSGARRPGDPYSCPSKRINAEWIETLVWHDCRAFLLNPGDALALAQSQLRERLAQARDLEPERTRLQAAITEKASERERVLTMFRRGRITVAEADAQMEAIQHEEAELQRHLTALRAQHDLTIAYEAQMVEASALLARLHGEVERVEHENDLATKRQVIELLVADIRADTEGTGRWKKTHLTVTYRFSPVAVAVSDTPRSSGSPGRRLIIYGSPSKRYTSLLSARRLRRTSVMARGTSARVSSIHGSISPPRLKS
jgi:site-specific DNA recombinase